MVFNYTQPVDPESLLELCGNYFGLDSVCIREAFSSMVTVNRNAVDVSYTVRVCNLEQIQ